MSGMRMGIGVMVVIIGCCVFADVARAEGVEFIRSKKKGPPPPAVVGGAATGIVAPGPSLLKNGDFEKGTGWPENWEKTKAAGSDAKTQAGVQIETATGEAAHGRVLHMKMDKAAADAPGMMIISEPLAVTQGKTYHVSVEVKSMAPAVILFVKGMGDYVAKNGKNSVLYEKKQESRLKKGEWGVMSFDFTPGYRGLNDAQRKVYEKRGIKVPTVNRIQIELFAYHPAGEVYFDNVRVTEGATGPAYITEDATKK